jgi:hypothetical protein
MRLLETGGIADGQVFGCFLEDYKNWYVEA